ncbi:TM2 domain-containing protein 1 isoform X2 [Castor canadensis]|uniref:TM2 domain-containing protein 1 isoform X2 n=1 Tax=Castor canadensis TaxID=51338 RepID=A0AC58N318_CASCN
MAAARASGAASPEVVAAQLLGVLWLATVTTGSWGAAATAAAGGEETLKCEDLRVGQYICKDPKINDATQEPVNCTNYTAHAPNITCKDFSGNETHFTGNEVGFLRPISCRNVNGYSYKVAVALSLFLGWLGADRFYLGYPALGLLKFCTVGFCGIGSLIDFILISMQRRRCDNGSRGQIDAIAAVMMEGAMSQGLCTASRRIREKTSKQFSSKPLEGHRPSPTYTLAQ